MWKAILSNNTEWIDTGEDDCWRKLLNHCTKNNLKISILSAYNKEVDKNVSHYFVLRESTVFFSFPQKFMATKVGIGTIRDWLSKAYIDWYDEKTHNKLYRQIISPDEYYSQYSFLPEIAIPAEKNP